VTYDLLGAGGAFHASIEVYGIEWSFGSNGIARSLPGSRWQELYRQSVTIGKTTYSKTDVYLIIREMESEHYNAEGYDVLLRNCGAFADAFCMQLNVGHIPSWVNRFAEASVSNTTCRKVASILGCESSALQISQQCQPQPKALPDPRVGHVKQHPVPRLAMSHLQNRLPDSLASSSSPKNLGETKNLGDTLRCPLADRTNQVADSSHRSPNKLQHHRSPKGRTPLSSRSPKGPTPSKMFQGRRCKAFAYDYDTAAADYDTDWAASALNRREGIESELLVPGDARIVWHN
jgi:hypothetical protein